jgi:hypothetical protein
MAKPCGAVGLVTTYAMGTKCRTHRASWVGSEGAFLRATETWTVFESEAIAPFGSTGRTPSQNPISYRRGALGIAERTTSFRTATDPANASGQRALTRA